MGDNLKQKMVSALAWTTVDRFGQQAVQFAIGLVLARLLSPDDFGLIGMVMIFSGLSFVIVESGFSQALIRKKEPDELDFNSVFYFNLGASILIYIILFWGIIPVSLFFKQPSLVVIGRVIFLAILFNALYLVPFAQLIKAMDFKTMAKVNLLSMVISGLTGVVLAITGFGVWSLVIQQVLYHFFRMVALYYFVEWRPKLLFSLNVIKNFWGFSINLLGTSILNVLFNNIYVMLLSRYYPIKQVGYYTQANKLSETFNFTFQSILVGSSYTMFTRIQDDNERFRRVLREVSKKTSIVTFPIMIVLIAIAKPFIYVLLSEKWMPTVPYFQIIALAGLFTPLYALNITALNAKGKSKTTFRVEFIKKILILLSVILSFKFGIIAMLWGYTAASFASYLITVIAIKQHTSHYITHQIKDLIPNILYGSILALTAFSLTYFISNMHLLLLMQVFTVVMLYLLIIRITQPEIFRKSMNFLFSKIGTIQEF